MWPLQRLLFLRAWWLDSEKKHPKQAFIGQSSHSPAQNQGQETQTPAFNERSVKEFLTVFNLPHIIPNKPYFSGLAQQSLVSHLHRSVDQTMLAYCSPTVTHIQLFLPSTFIISKFFDPNYSDGREVRGQGSGEKIFTGTIALELK